MNGIHFSSTLFLACLAATTIAQQAGTPSSRENVLDEAVVQNERERERQPSPTFRASNPDVISVTRNGSTAIRLRLLVPQSQIRFRRESAARLPSKTGTLTAYLKGDLLSAPDGKAFSEASFELAASIDEDDGLPALIPFSPRSSLINIDYLRLRDTKLPTVFNVRNVVDPQTRRCETQGGWAEDRQIFSNRFLLISDRPNDCKDALQNRHGDLLLADSVPEMLQQNLREIYEPIAARFSSRLGSEPGLVYVAWWPESPHDDVRFEASWNRSALLLFNGTRWQNGIPANQQDQLRESFIRDQVQRRIRETDQPGMFTTSAVSYLVLLARAELEKNTNGRLAAELPVWIARCANRLDGRVLGANSSPDVPGDDCGQLLQFVHDAVARAGSGGEKTVYDTWRQLLQDASLRRTGVSASVFMKSSSGGDRIARSLLRGSMDWPKFAEELGKIGVQLRIRQDQLGVTAQVVSLANFR